VSTYGAQYFKVEAGGTYRNTYKNTYRNTYTLQDYTFGSQALI
jgi:hypothetical protein